MQMVETTLSKVAHQLQSRFVFAEVGQIVLALAIAFSLSQSIVRLGDLRTSNRCDIKMVMGVVG
jgi:hypothetical protein